MLRNPWVLFGAALLIAALVLFPRISAPGLWEPEEMKVADQAVARADRKLGPLAEKSYETVQKNGARAPVAPPTECPKEARDDTGARELTPNLAAIGIAALGSSEGSMRTLFALLGLIGVLAAYGIGARIGTPRGGLFGAIVLLSFPLFVLQARQLTTDVGTAVGATLMVYGMVAAARPVKGPLMIVDLLVAGAAAVFGAVLAFLGGGALLGLMPPLAAIALAGGLGVSMVIAGVRLVWYARVPAIGALSPRYAIGRTRLLREVIGVGGQEAAEGAAGLLTALAALLVLFVLAYQVYDVQDMAPGTREIFGKSFVPTECWSEWLGGIWRAHDDGKATYDSMFEQMAFGMYPWSVFAPVALAGLALGLVGDRHRWGGRVLLAWASIAWVCGSVFERKVGFAIYSGYPACAIAVGVWLDRMLDGIESDRAEGKGSPVGLLVGLWVFLGMLTIGKDLQSFPDKLTSLLVSSDTIKYPAKLHLKSWILVLGVLTGLAFAVGTWVVAIDVPSKHSWKYVARRSARWAIYASVFFTALFGIFWAQAWQPGLSRALSSKNVFSVYRKLHRGDEKLGILGDMGNAPRYYADGPLETVKSRDDLVGFLDSEERVFALAPANELCAIHRTFAGKSYYVLDDSNTRFMLLSNQLGGAKDRNPLPGMIMREKPEGIDTEFHATYDDRIELIGYTMPRTVALRSKFTMTLYFHVKKPIAGAWTIFAHFDYRGQRFQGDHKPIRDRCATSFWQEGDYVVDTFEVEAGDLTNEGGNYQVLIGFFTGQNPNWKNMNVTQAPPGAKDKADRVLLGTIQVE